MKYAVAAVFLVALAGAFPSLYGECELPTTGFKGHGAPVIGFDGDYEFMFTDMDDNEVDSFMDGSTYKVSVMALDGASFRATMITDGGMFDTSDPTGAPLCEGQRVNFVDMASTLTAMWTASDAMNVTFSVNIAPGCAFNYVQDSLVVYPMM
eukprot:TRINITY_DN3544_c0_g1_i1.p1 TRINITY_DN3544_c0_g1~~TRINITY_DN3544_c0_g1_i1.p1  ORF type:complete len:152 (-),score=28.80 TRINITY_DN3544_c0_g1_i1:321-776(-)